MARHYSEADYCAEEMARKEDYCHGGGGERYVVRKEEYEEIDEVERARRGHHRGHGHLGRSGSHNGHLGRSGSYSHGASGYLGHSGSHRGHLGHSGSVHGHREQHHHGHGYVGSDRDPCESKYDSCTGQYYG